MNNILNKAKVKEKKYDWVKAAELYERTLRMIEKTEFSRKGEIQERIGRCFYRAAFQAESNEEFKRRMRRAITACEKARELYENEECTRKLRVDAVVDYLRHWLSSDQSEKRTLLDECLELEGKALEAFSESGDMLEYGKTYSQLPQVFHERYRLEWDLPTLMSILESGLRWGEKAVAALSELGDAGEIAEAYFTLATCLSLLAPFIEEPEKQEQQRLKVVEYLGKAVDLSKEDGDAHLLGHSHYWLGYETGKEEAVKHSEKTLEYGKQTRDNYLIAAGLASIAGITLLKASETEDPEKRMELAEKGLEISDESQHQFSVSSYKNFAVNHAFNVCDIYFHLSTWETDTERRLELLEKSERAGMKALKLAESTDDSSLNFFVHSVVGKVFAARAHMEPNPSGKRSRLEMALKYRQKSIEIIEKLWPFSYWWRGDVASHLAEIKGQLADIEPDLDIKRELLEEAVLGKENSLRLINKGMPYMEKMVGASAFAGLHGRQDSYATLLTRLYDVSRNPEHLRRAIEILLKAIESASKTDLVSRIGESYWKIAKAQDNLGEYIEAATNFQRASESYVKAARKVPQLKDFYQDYASYMEAWNEIENAKHRHEEKQYGLAKEHYEKAADLHRSTERWNYFSQNYLAWAQLEEAEALSRAEQNQEATRLFQQAGELFKEAKKFIEAKLGKIEARDEKEMAAELAKASDIRREYCLGRIALEEARILDKQGNHSASSKKYGSAAARFRKAIAATERESDRQELRPIVVLCRAWQMMTRAEAEASPHFYLEASQLFDEAKEHSLDEKAKVLALGHSRFCKALEVGARFEVSRDTTSYAIAKKHIEAATNCYVKAGFKTASEYAKATYRLFDAYMYMNQAQTETEPEKKTQFYQMAERLLQASAGSYMKAKHPEKSEEVQRLLESVKEERQLAMSLVEVLHAPSIASATASFSSPTPVCEKAVGLERFDHAHVQANLFIQLREVRIDENVALEIDLVNAGKGPATLVKVEDIVPVGFNIIEKPDMYRVEDSYLNLKGKRLDPLKSEEVKVVVKPQSKGTFLVKPRILYIDETGKSKSHEPDPVTITVKELGIKGWIKGER